MEVAQPAVRVDELAEQQRPPVAEARRVAAELVTGVGLRDGNRPVRDRRPHQQGQAVGTGQPGCVEPQLARQRLVEGEQCRIGRGGGLPLQRHLRQLAGEAVFEDDGGDGCGAHPIQGTENSPALAR